MLDWAGIGIIVGVQVATFLYTLRRMDAMQATMYQEFGAMRQEISALTERVARLEGILIGKQEVGNGTLTPPGGD